MRRAWAGLALAGLLAPGVAHAERCDRPLAFRSAAASNAASQSSLAIAPFGRAETGWETYAPLIADEIKTDCAPDTPGFARALARWRGRHDLGHGGVMDAAVLLAMKSAWQDRRAFVAGHPAQACPEPPDLAALEAAAPEESDGGKIILLRARAMAAYRRMVAAARAEVSEAAADPERLMLFSGFRDPEYDAERCASQGNCNGLVRAQCSSHRTGVAMDIYLGSAPGFDADSSADVNRLWQTRTQTYRWLVVHARRYGFVNYAFEPWHWEWVEGAR
jgi:D-alanyl-D-alanine carboxypeptidase